MNNPASRTDYSGNSSVSIPEILIIIIAIILAATTGCSNSVETVDCIEETPPIINVEISSNVETAQPPIKYPPVIESYINEAKKMIGESYDKRDCAQLVRASVLMYDPGFRRGARYQWANYNSTLWLRQEESDITKIPAGALLYYKTEEGKIVHTAIYLGRDMMIDSTDRADIFGVSERSAKSELTYDNKPITISGYLYPKNLK